jgi:hypothetical protein
LAGCYRVRMLQLHVLRHGQLFWCISNSLRSNCVLRCAQSNDKIKTLSTTYKILIKNWFFQTANFRYDTLHVSNLVVIYISCIIPSNFLP